MSCTLLVMSDTRQYIVLRLAGKELHDGQKVLLCEDFGFLFVVQLLACHAQDVEACSTLTAYTCQTAYNFGKTMCASTKAHDLQGPCN